MYGKRCIKTLAMLFLLLSISLLSCQVQRSGEDFQYGALFFPWSDGQLAYMPADCLISGSHCSIPQIVPLHFDLFRWQSDVAYWRGMNWSHNAAQALVVVHGPPYWDTEAEDEAFLFDFHRSTLRSLIQMAYIDDVSWSHDGKWLAMIGVKEGKDATTTEVQASLSNIFLISLDSSKVRNLTEELQGIKRRLSWLNQDTLLFELENYSKGCGIYTLNIQNEEWAELPGEFLCNAFPQPSPDGQRIVYSQVVKDSAGGYIMNADGSNRKLVAESKGWRSVYPNWSPDQNWIGLNVISMTKTLESAVYVVHPNGTNLQKMYQSQNLIYGTWMPVGSSHLLVMERDKQTSQIIKWALIAAPDGNVTTVLSFHGSSIPQWLSWRPPTNIQSGANSNSK